MRLLVTGGTGLLGNNIVRLAIERGAIVSTLCRSDRNSPAFHGLDVHVHSVDLAEPDALKRVFEEQYDAVIHCAAHIHIGWQQRNVGMRINRDGTERLLAECSKQKLRFIHVSTINTLSLGTRERPADENTTGGGQVPCTYVVTKQAAEQRAIEASNRGQDVVIVHPGFMLGPWDWKPSSGRMIQGLRGFVPLAPSGGCTVCDPRDVAAATLQAIERGIAGRHYILGGENLTYLDLWRRISSALGKRGPWTYMRLPAKLVAGAVGDLIGTIKRNEPDINSAAISMASQFHWYSSQRAIDELGYSPRPVDDSIRDAVEWLRSHRLLV
ncbi:MAG: NAD-dependent epimerase/dehydratase family protein [Pirellula sp.]